MKRILLLEAKARFVVSVGSAFLALVVISLGFHEGWRQETKAYREWVSSGRAELCAQIRGDTLAPREVLAQIGWEPPRCDPTRSLARPQPGARNNPTDLTEQEIRKLAQEDFLKEWYCKQIAREDGEKWLALLRVGCARESSLGQFLDNAPRASRSFPQYVWDQLTGESPQTPVLLSIVALGTFFLLSAARLFLTEAHLRWRRVSLVMAAFAFLITPLTILLLADRVGDDEVGLAITSGFAALPLAILFVLGGKWVSGWVAVGFRPDAGTGDQSSTVTVRPRQANRLEPRGVPENREHGGPARRHEGPLADTNDQAESPEGASLGGVSMTKTLVGALLDLASAIVIAVAVALVLVSELGRVVAPSGDRDLLSALLAYAIGLAFFGGVLWGLRRIRRRVYRYAK